MEHSRTDSFATMIKDEFDVLVKILIVGDSSVGKSCLLLRYADENFSTEHAATIGVDFKMKTIKMQNGSRVKLQIWDTAGQERFKSITSSYYRGAHAIVLVYDITNQNSFNSIANRWLPDARNHAPSHATMVLVGNKCDLKERRLISTSEGKRLAEELGIAFYETSARTDTNVSNLFSYIVEKVMQDENFFDSKTRSGIGLEDNASGSRFGCCR